MANKSGAPARNRTASAATTLFHSQCIYNAPRGNQGFICLTVLFGCRTTGTSGGGGLSAGSRYFRTGAWQSLSRSPCSGARRPVANATPCRSCPRPQAEEQQREANTLADGGGFEPPHPFGLAGLAPRCITALPTVHSLSRTSVRRSAWCHISGDCHTSSKNRP